MKILILMLSWIEEVKLLRWIFFLPIGFISYLSFVFIGILWPSSEDHVYLMIFIVDFIGVFIGVYLTTIIAPKDNLKIAWIFFGISIIILCFTIARSILLLQTDIIHSILSSSLNVGACGFVLFCIIHNINFFEELKNDKPTLQ